jgi:hypothetical protein
VCFYVATVFPLSFVCGGGGGGGGCTGCDTRVSVCALPAHSGRAAAGLGFASLEPPPRAVDDEHPAREAAGERERYTT